MRRPLATLTALFASAALVAGCAPPQDAATQETEQVTEGEHRERAAEAWSAMEAGMAAGEAEEAVAVFSEDVWVRGVGPEIESLRGRAAYRDLLSGLFEAFAIDRLEVEIEDVIVLDDHVYEAGSFSETIRIQETDQTIPIRGSYSALWRQDADGSWKVHRFMWNEQPPEEEGTS